MSKRRFVINFSTTQNIQIHSFLSVKICKYPFAWKRTGKKNDISDDNLANMSGNNKKV